MQDISTLPDPGTVAAVDLGSNSFHMIVARVEQGHLHMLDRVREMVRLAGGLGRHQCLTEEARERALACLERFGERVRELPPGSVRAVGTNTLRRARDAAEFLEAAEAALGHPLEVISGREEARLIYLGVAHSLAGDRGRRLVMDIGGGSTELIIGERFEPRYMESLPFGCVRMSEGSFPDGLLTEDHWKRAAIAVHLELQTVAAEFRRIGWNRAVGASGTIRTVAEVVREAHWSPSGITLNALKKLRKAMMQAAHVDRLAMAGLSAERAPVFAGGVAILLATFEALRIEHMVAADGALREGLLYDLLGRFRHEDVRERTIHNLMERYHVDGAQADRVESTALMLLAQVTDAWNLRGDERIGLLSWAARLHEIGLTVAHSSYHKHGAYLLENMDLPGFSFQEQHMLAALIRGHRRKFSLSRFKRLPAALAVATKRLCLLLRLAVLLHRSRTDVELPPIALAAEKNTLRVTFPAGWLEGYPLTKADMQREAQYLEAAKITLEFA
jgi:exopolyphosphatase/guanosine-5'-triphosphate,3'-diphosphate pyrophosphatase